MVLVTNRTPKNINSLKWKLAAYIIIGIITSSTVITSFIINPIYILTRMSTRITPNSSIYNFLKNEINGGHISVMLFNYTNADRFMNEIDDKLKVEEVGPFTYKETKINEGMELDLEAGILKYTPRVIKTLVPEESIGNPEDYIITMPNLPMLGISSLISKFSLIPRMGFNLLTRQLNCKSMVTIDARSYLWGYEEPLIKLAYTLAPGLVNFDKIGILDRLYDANVNNSMVVSARDEDKLMILSRNGHKKLARNKNQDPDECESCDSFVNSYEGLMYPSPVTPETPIRIYRPGVCKIFDMVFHEKKVYENSAVGFVYNLSDTFFYPNGSGDGLLDLSECLHGLPMSLSKVHFLDMDKKIYERIEGMKLEKMKLNTYIVIEPLMGMELDTYVPIQVNLVLGDMSFNSEARRFSNMVIPICYVEIKQEKLSESANLVLKRVYVYLPLIIFSSQVVLIMLTMLFFGYSLKLYLDSRNKHKNAISFPLMLNGRKSGFSVENSLLFDGKSR